MGGGWGGMEGGKRDGRWVGRGGRWQEGWEVGGEGWKVVRGMGGGWKVVRGMGGGWGGVEDCDSDNSSSQGKSGCCNKS